MAGFTGALGSLWIDVGARIDDFKSKMREVSAEVSAIVEDAKGKISMLDIGSGLAGVGAGLSAVVTGPMVLLGKQAVESATQLDSLTRGLTAVAGSSEAADKQLVSLREVAKLPGLGFKEAVQGSINLQAAGFSAAQAEGALKGFGNALATVGKGKADLDGVILALGQIASKGKISAEEINQLAERVPQIRKIMEQAFGTADTQVLQKAGIGAQEFVDKVTTELLKLPPVTGGLQNTFENLSDKLDQTLSAIGKNLAPVVAAVGGVLEKVLDWVQKAAEWFGQLPEPVKAGAGAFAAMLAALGPLLVAVGGGLAAFSSFTGLFASGGLLAGLGVTAAGFSSVALAIPLVLAALTALGTWVYANWDGIVAVVSTAWDGVSEAWHAIWDPIGSWIEGVWAGISDALSTAWSGISSVASAIWNPIAEFFSKIWDNIGPYFTSAWNGIANAISSVWNGIKSVATSVWSAITGAIGSFLEAAAKIPGVNKLLNLDDAWSSAKKASEEIKKAGEETKNLAKSADNAGGGSSKPVPKLAAALGKVKKAAKETVDEVKPLKFHNDLLEATVKAQTAEWRKLGKEIVEAKAKLAELGDSVGQMLEPNEDLNASINRMATSMHDVAKTKVPDVLKAMTDTGQATTTLGEAFKTLGVRAETDYNKVAEQAKKAYEVIKGSGIATPTEQNNAMLAMLKAQREAAIHNGEQIPKETEQMIAKMEAAVKDPSTGLPKVKGAFESFGTEVSTVVTNLAQSLAKDLFSGDMSFAEKGIGALKKLGEAAFSKFAEPFMKAGTDLMNGVISDLLGGKGFGGLIDRVKEVGETFTKIFGSGSDIASVASGAGKTGAGAAGAVGGAGGAGGAGGGGAATGGLGSVMGAIGAIGSAVGAISGVIGNFQNARQETTLNAIEENTRYIKIWTGEGEWSIKSSVNAAAEHTRWALDWLSGIQQRVEDLKPGLDSLSTIKDKATWSLVKLSEISTNTQWGSQTDKDNGSILNQMLTELRTMAAKTPIINVYVGGESTPSPANVKLAGIPTL